MDQDIINNDYFFCQIYRNKLFFLIIPKHTLNLFVNSQIKKNVDTY